MSGSRLLTLAVIAPALLAGADQPPKLRLAEVQNAQPRSYRVELALDPSKTSFDGSIRIALTIQQPLRTLWLNASKITVKSAVLSTGGKSLNATALPGGDDFIGLRFDSEVPAGSSDLTITYSGSVRGGESSGVFVTEDKGNKYILTQFEATDARDAFPCFDEPSYKVPWQLTLKVPDADKAISNSPVTRQSSAGGMTTYEFAETKPLPSYLVAFGVGPFEFVSGGKACKRGVPVRIVTPKGRSNEAKYAAEVTATILTRLEEYFGVPFPYDKSDQVAVPVTIGFGAMENAGMVTYGQNIILADPASDSIARQRGYATTAAHELAHQWFGDLVTTSWWNDIWLNEAFATWMEQKLIAEWKPEWKTRMDDVNQKLFAAREDSLISARKIRQPIENKGDIGNAFDGITYQKGAAVIGMFESWMGEAQFRKGVQSYMRQYAFKTTNAGDFLDSLSTASKRDVGGAFSTFLNQAGIPLVSVALDCKENGASLRLQQKRFLPLGSKGSADQVWSIPVCVRYGSGENGANACTLMTAATMDWPLPNAGTCPAWVQANARAKGYYRFEYEGDLLRSLTAGNVVGRLDGPERVDLIGDTVALAASGAVPEAQALTVAEEFHADPERDVLNRAFDAALAPYPDLVSPDLMDNYRRFLAKNFGAKAHALGWIPKPGESDDARLLRPALVSGMATVGGDQELAQQARDLAAKWLRDPTGLSPDVVGAVLQTAAYYGDKGLFDQYLAAFQRSQNRQDQQHLLNAMLDFRDPAALQAGMETVLAGKVSLADGFLLYFGGRNDPATRKLSFEFVKSHFDQIMAGNPSIFGFPFASFLPRVGETFCDPQSRTEFDDFFKERVKQYEGAPRAMAQAEERIELCEANKSAQEPSVSSFLKNY